MRGTEGGETMPMIICPVCGVGSNPWPDYLSSKGTAVMQRLSYCGHRIDDKVAIVSIVKDKEVKNEPTI